MSRMQERLSIPHPQRLLELHFGDAVVRKVPVLVHEVSGDLVFPPWGASVSTGDSVQSPSSTEPRLGLDILINAEMTLDNIGAQSVSDGHPRSDATSAMMSAPIRTAVALEYMRQVREESFLEIQEAVDDLPLNTCVKLTRDLPDNQRILVSTLDGVEAVMLWTTLESRRVTHLARSAGQSLGLGEEQGNWTLPEAQNTVLIKWEHDKYSLPCRIDFNPSHPWVDSTLEAMGICDELHTPTPSQLEEMCASSPEQDV